MPEGIISSRKGQHGRSLWPLEWLCILNESYSDLLEVPGYALDHGSRLASGHGPNVLSTGNMVPFSVLLHQERHLVGHGLTVLLTLMNTVESGSFLLLY